MCQRFWRGFQNIFFKDDIVVKPNKKSISFNVIQYSSIRVTALYAFV